MPYPNDDDYRDALFLIRSSGLVECKPADSLTALTYRLTVLCKDLQDQVSAAVDKDIEAIEGRH